MELCFNYTHAQNDSSVPLWSHIFSNVGVEWVCSTDFNTLSLTCRHASINNNMNTVREMEKKKKDKSKDLHPPASPPTRPSYTIHLHTGPGILFTDWFIWTFYSFVLFCGEQQIISWWVLMVEGIFASRWPKKKKKILVMDNHQQSTSTGAQWILYRLAQFMAAFCDIVTHFITRTSSFCIKHLSDSATFCFLQCGVQCFSVHSHIASREIPQECVLIHSQKDPLKPPLLLFFSFFFISHKVSLSPWQLHPFTLPHQLCERSKLFRVSMTIGNTHFVLYGKRLFAVIAMHWKVWALKRPLFLICVIYKALKHVKTTK